MQARIYQPSKSAMTSGQGNSRVWTLEYVQEEAKRIDPLMGWTGSGDMRGQVRLRFEYTLVLFLLCHVINVLLRHTFFLCLCLGRRLRLSANTFVLFFMGIHLSL